MKKYIIAFVLLILCSGFVYAEVKILDTTYINNNKAYTNEPFAWDFKIITICKNGYQYTITTNSGGTSIVQDIQAFVGGDGDPRIIRCN